MSDVKYYKDTGEPIPDGYGVLYLERPIPGAEWTDLGWWIVRLAFEDYNHFKFTGTELVAPRRKVNVVDRFQLHNVRHVEWHLNSEAVQAAIFDFVKGIKV